MRWRCWSREAGKLVSKDRFLEEVWRGVPVTDEALTQCIKTLRRQLGDDAARARASSRRCPSTATASSRRSRARSRRRQALWCGRAPRLAGTSLLLGAAGTIGGGVAGFIGGIFYGFAGASQPLAARHGSGLDAARDPVPDHCRRADRGRRRQLRDRQRGHSRGAMALERSPAARSAD